MAEDKSAKTASESKSLQVSSEPDAGAKSEGLREDSDTDAGAKEGGSQAEPEVDAVTGASPGTAQACADLGLNSLEQNLIKLNIKPPGVS